MFPHTITIIHHSIVNSTDVYSRTVLSGFYWYGAAEYGESGKGAEKNRNVTVISSPEMAASYGSEWSVCGGDRIVKGACPAITSYKDLIGKEVITVLSVAENICGSDVDNIQITGK